MRWQDIDVDQARWTVPREVSKNNVPNEVPLSPLAVEIIRDLPQFAEEKYVSPAANRLGRPVSGYSKAKLQLDDEINKRRDKDEKTAMASWWLHDLRRTAASSMVRLGVAPQ